MPPRKLIRSTSALTWRAVLAATGTFWPRNVGSKNPMRIFVLGDPAPSTGVVALVVDALSGMIWTRSAHLAIDPDFVHTWLAPLRSFTVDPTCDTRHFEPTLGVEVAALAGRTELIALKAVAADMASTATRRRRCLDVVLTTGTFSRSRRPDPENGALAAPVDAFTHQRFAWVSR